MTSLQAWTLIFWVQNLMHSSSLSFSFPVEKAGHRPNPFQEVLEALWITYKQTPVMNSQESNPRALWRFAELVKLETSDKWLLPVVADRSVNVKPRSFHHEKEAAQEGRRPQVKNDT